MDEPTPIEPESDGTIAETGMDDLPDGLATTADGAAAAASGGLARRGMLVFGVFVIIVVGAIAFALAGGDDGDGESAATESESEADADAQSDGDGDGTGDDSTDGETSDDSTASDGDTGGDDSGDTSEEARGTYSIVDVAADEGMYYGGEAPIAWGDGFLSIRQEFVPSEVTFPELVPDLADRFPAEVADTLEAAGVDLEAPGGIDDAIAALNEAGLYDAVAQIVIEDPELSQAYNEILSGGTYVQVAEYSADGITWEPVDFTFDVPENAWPDYRSNGEHLIAVVTHNSWGENGERLEFSVTVHATSDLVTWTSVDIPFELPSAPDYVQVDGWTDQVAIGPDGWYIGISINQYVDLWSLLPDRIRNGNYSWNPMPDGIRIEDWESMYEAEMAAAESGDYEALEVMEPEVVEVIPWSDLPLTYEEWSAANFNHEQGRQAFTGTFDGSVSPAASPEGLEWFQLAGTGDGYVAWGQLHTPSELTMQDLIPDIEERFPAEIIDAFAEAGYEVGDAESIEFAQQFLAEAGLLDLATETVMNDPELLDAFMEVTSGGTYETVAFFSADGSSWSPVTFPDVDWPDSIAPVAGGVLLIGSSEAGGQEFWLGDLKTGTWEQVDGPDLGENVWLYFDTRSTGSSGLAAVIDSAQYYGPDYLAWTATVEHDGFELTMSADGEGSQSLTIVEIATGQVVRDTTIEMWTEELFIWGENSFDFVDDDGELIVSLPMDVGEELAWGAESEAWEAWHEANPYQPELTLVATIDGRDWIVQELDVPASPDGWYGGGAAAINNGVAVYRDASGWHRLVVG